VLWILVIAAVTPLAALRLTALRWLPVPLLAGAAAAVAAQLAFDAGRILPVAAPALALLTAVLGTLAVAYATDLRDRRRLRAAFGRFVPPSVVDEVVAQAGDDLRLGGVRREGTVLFCDLRGFTAAAERLEPEAVVALLNAYLSQMSAAILDHGGTVVSFMGDGIMAVFGAPLAQEDHADRALRAAREMLGPRLDAFNARAGAGEPFRLGVGICSGPVLSGNVGSPRRVEYTAVGDTTNLAARLEQCTKTAGVPVLIADRTRAALRDEPAAGLRRVGELEIRGREGRLETWTFDEA
jgi:adenylate cyclase